MASFRKRGRRWQVQVRREGSLPLTRTFSKRSDAATWAARMELEIECYGLPENIKLLDKLTVRDLIGRYQREVLPTKRACAVETTILNAFLRQPLADTRLSGVTPGMFRTYCNDRLLHVKPATVNREFGLIQHAFETARREWSWPLRENPLALIRKLKPDAGRVRRLSPMERGAIFDAASKCRNKAVLPIIRLALETAMRRGELLAMRWDHVDWARRTLHIPHTKNGYSRTIPLTDEALSIIGELRRTHTDRARVFNDTGEAVKHAWRRLVRRAGVVDLHFHDLRHEAISSYFEIGLSMPEVALISGHRDYRMLARYTHLTAERVGEKLRGRTLPPRN